jgi:hypothetical protein
MTWTPSTLGPGPERITNEWLNALQGQLESNLEVLKTFHAGVVWGCEVSFHEADFLVDPPLPLRVKVGQGAAVSNGVYHRVNAIEITVDGEPGQFVWVYIDATGEAVISVQNIPLWPEQVLASPPADVQPNLAVLALGQIGEGSPPGETWEWAHDLRHFVREKPNGAVLVVGDLDAGADFEDIQQALDYLGACDLGQNDVPRRILVTRHQDVSAPLLVRCHGVSIEGVLNEVGAPEDDEPEERVVLTWSFSDTSVPANGALINVAGFQDVNLQDLHLIHRGSTTWCAVHDPGDRFRMERCIIGEPETTDSLLSVVIDFGGGTTTGAHISENIAYGLHRGLFGFTLLNPDQSSATEGFVTGCLQRSLVQRNFVSTTGLIEPDSSDRVPSDPCWNVCGEPLPEGEIWSWTDPRKYFYAIDLGVNPDATTGCLYNVVQENVIQSCFNGIRVGAISKVHSNVVRQCVLFGVMATSTGVVDPAPLAGDADAMGATEISGNTIELDTFPGAPWWRAGIRLEMTTCYVGFNTVATGIQPGCGIIHGPLDLSDRIAIKTHFAALRPGKHAVVGNTVMMQPIEADGSFADFQVISLKGIGVGLFSVHNRITDNCTVRAQTGILVTAYSAVSNNTIELSVVAIFAWSYNSVTGNTIGWFPHTSAGLPWDLLKPMTFAPVLATVAPYISQGTEDDGSRAAQPSVLGSIAQLQAFVQIYTTDPGLGAIMLSNGNSCDGNTITCGMDDSFAARNPVAIYVKDWATELFGGGWSTFFDETFWGDISAAESPFAAQLKAKTVGGNVISNSVIQLADPEGDPLSATGSFKADGILLNGDWAGNTVSGAFIWRGQAGITAESQSARITASSAWYTNALALQLNASPLSSVSGCVFVTSGNRTAGIGSGSPDTSIDDCLLIQLASPEQGEGVPLTHFTPSQLPPPCLVVEADRVAVNDCAFLNNGNVCIEWSGSFGVSGGCYFVAGSGDIPADPGSVTKPRFAAIRFATTGSAGGVDESQNYYPGAATQGNLVFGAHMLRCAPLGVNDDPPRSPIEWSNNEMMYNPDYDEPAGDRFTVWNPDPPQYNIGQQRWTNRVSVESCFYWELLDVVQ